MHLFLLYFSFTCWGVTRMAVKVMLLVKQFTIRFMFKFLCSKSAFLPGTPDFLVDAPKNWSFELKITAGILLSSPRGIFSLILREEGTLCEEGKIWQFWHQGGCLCAVMVGRYIGFWWMVCVLRTALDGVSMNGSVSGHRPPDAHNPVVCGALCVFCLSYYCTFVHTLVLSKVAGRRPMRVAVVCGAFFLLLLYFCTYLCFVQGHRPPAIAHQSCLWCVFGDCVYQTMLLLYIPLSQWVLFSILKVIYQYLGGGWLRTEQMDRSNNAHETDGHE